MISTFILIQWMHIDDVSPSSVVNFQSSLDDAIKEARELHLKKGKASSHTSLFQVERGKFVIQWDKGMK